MFTAEFIKNLVLIYDIIKMKLGKAGKFIMPAFIICVILLAIYAVIIETQAIAKTK